MNLEHEIKNMCTHLAETYELPPEEFERGLRYIAQYAVKEHMEMQAEQNKR